MDTSVGNVGFSVCPRMLRHVPLTFRLMGDCSSSWATAAWHQITCTTFFTGISWPKCTGLLTHLGYSYFCTFVDKLDHIVGLSLVWSYKEALGKCEDLSFILLAHEEGQVMQQPSNTVLQMVGNAKMALFWSSLTHCELHCRHRGQTGA